MKNTEENISKIKFYPHSYHYAAMRNEIELFRNDIKARRKACKLFEEIVNKNFKEYVLDSEKALAEMFKRIGKERTKAIICSTVNAVSGHWDKRYSNSTYEWAATSEYDFDDLITSVHPCLVNALAECLIKAENSDV